MLFEIDWKGVPKREQLPKKLITKMEQLFGKKVPKAKKREANVAFVGTTTMRSLNRIYRGKDKVTDVLSFERSGKSPFPHEDAATIGDIILCLPYIRRSAKKQKVSLAEELVRMMVHGAMHCLGYDHMKPKDAVKMFPLQERIIREIVAK